MRRTTLSAYVQFALAAGSASCPMVTTFCICKDRTPSGVAKYVFTRALSRSIATPTPATQICSEGGASWISDTVWTPKKGSATMLLLLEVSYALFQAQHTPDSTALAPQSV